MNTRYIWFALGIGGAIGAGVALLFAPNSGAKTRKQLRQGIDDAVDSVQEAGSYLEEQAGKLSVEAGKALRDAADKASGLIDQVVEVSAAQTKAAKSLF